MSTEIISETFLIVISVAFFGYVVYASFSIFLDYTKYLKDDIRLFFQHKANPSLKADYEKHLAGKFAYYDRLPEKHKIKFLLRVKSFISVKEFSGRNELVVTDEMKVLIAASAIQLTFGLEKYRFDDFSKIIIYPESYYSKLDDNYHMGETNIQGVIVFSWKDFLDGYSNKSDAFNVGLHEMTHALELEQHLGGDYDFYFATCFEKFSLITKEEFNDVYDERETFLRKYAGTNRQEFFAVCMEYFFEKSEEFKKRLPAIYYNLCVLVNQDPLTADGEVTEEAQPDGNKIMAELQSSVPVFSSSNRIFGIDMLFLLYPFFIGYMVKSSSKIRVASLIVPFLLFFGLFTVFFIFRLNKFIIYDKYLVVKNVFGKIRGIYPLSKIISIAFHSYRNADNVTLLIPSKGRILKFRHSYRMKKGEREIFTNMLRQKEVVIKG